MTDHSMICLLGAAVENGEGGFLRKIIGFAFGVIGLIFFLGSAVGMVRFLIFTPACMRVRGTPCPQCSCLVVWFGHDGGLFRGELAVTDQSRSHSFHLSHYQPVPMR